MVTFILFQSPSSAQSIGGVVLWPNGLSGTRQVSKVSSVWWALFCRSQLISAPRHPAPAFSLLLPRLAPSVAGSFALFPLVLLRLLVHVPQGFCLLSLLWDRNHGRICLRPQKAAAHNVITASRFPTFIPKIPLGGKISVSLLYSDYNNNNNVFLDFI